MTSRRRTYGGEDPYITGLSFVAQNYPNYNGLIVVGDMGNLQGSSYWYINFPVYTYDVVNNESKTESHGVTYTANVPESVKNSPGSISDHTTLSTFNLDIKGNGTGRTGDVLQFRVESDFTKLKATLSDGSTETDYIDDICNKYDLTYEGTSSLYRSIVSQTGNSIVITDNPYAYTYKDFIEFYIGIERTSSDSMTLVVKDYTTSLTVVDNKKGNVFELNIGIGPNKPDSEYADYGDTLTMNITYTP